MEIGRSMRFIWAAIPLRMAGSSSTTIKFTECIKIHLFFELQQGSREFDQSSVKGRTSHIQGDGSMKTDIESGIGIYQADAADMVDKPGIWVIHRLFDKLNISASEKKLSNFKSGLNKGDNLYRDREKLVRTYEGLKNDIQTYENNLGFLSSASKKGNTLVTEITRKIERLKGEMELVLKKIQAIDEKLNEE